MAQNISDTVLTNVIDHMTAVVKGQVGAYTTTEDEDLFRILVREQNPDDLSSGTAIVENIDDSLAAGTPYATIWSTVLSWLGVRATSAGYSGIDTLLAARHLRVPYTFDKYIYYPTYGTHIATPKVFADQYWNGSAWATYSLGTYTQADALPRTLTADTMDTSITAFWGRAKVGTGGIAAGAEFEFILGVTYPDASTGTETVVCTRSSTVGTYFDIGAAGCSATISPAGHADKKVYTGSTAGFVAGQTVAIWSGDAHSLLSEDALTGVTQITISTTDIGYFNIGDLIYIYDGNSSAQENSIIDIDYENGTIDLRIATNADFTTAQSAIVYKRRVATLTGNTTSGTATVTVSLNDIGGFAAGDVITMYDSSPSTEKGTILSVAYDTGVITLTGNVAADYTTAATATITKDITDYGRTEYGIIDTIQAGTSITLTTPLQYTYVDPIAPSALPYNCKIVRLLRSINTVTALNTGTAGDDVIFEPKIERPITQGSILV